MSDDAAFLRAILADPADDATRLVYADWLDEQGRGEKAEFLRLTASREPDEERLRTLAALLDTDWLAVVSRPKVENCDRKRPSTSLFRFDFLCDRAWDAMAATADSKVRHCDTCGKHVHFCDTIMEARDHAGQGHCVAVDLGIPRRPGDLEPRRMWLGRPSVSTLQAEEERLQPDPVSEERQRRKDAGGG